MTRALIILIALSACTPSTATHHALHEGRDVGQVSMVNAPAIRCRKGMASEV